MAYLIPYQLDFVRPGIRPALPSSRSMIRDSEYPEDLFEGSPQTLQALRARIQASLGGAPQF